MKYLILLAVIVAVLWLARGGKRRVASREAAKPPSLPQEEMVACSQCGLHLPRNDALPGRGGLFCSEAHRSTFEQTRG